MKIIRIKVKTQRDSELPDTESAGGEEYGPVAPLVVWRYERGLELEPRRDRSVGVRRSRRREKGLSPVVQRK